MARSDLILNLVRSVQRGDLRTFQRSVEAMIAEERSKKHSVFAGKLETELHQSQPTAGLINGKKTGQGRMDVSPVGEFEPQLTLDSLCLSKTVEVAARELIEEHQRADLLRTHGVEPRNRVLLTGAPGNGKTSLAEAIATHLMVPVVYPRYESLIGSYLGETANRLGKLFEYVRSRRCVLFFDEFDTLGRERADSNETGEIKRVVSSLLLEIDRLPSHVVTIVATNHPETLDRAVWRRFQVRLELSPPSKADVVRWFEGWSAATGIPLGLRASTLVEGLEIESFAELRDFCDDIQRRLILSGSEQNIRKIFKSRFAQWKERVRASNA